MGDTDHTALLDQLEDWTRRQAAVAKTAGIELVFNRTTDDRPKPAAWATGEAGGRLAELIVWSTGEAEFATGFEGAAHTNEHHEIAGHEQLHALLARLWSWLNPGASVVGQHRDGFVCVALFMPPDAPSRAQAWKETNIDRYGPPHEWRIDVGRALGGDFFRFWVPEQHAAPTSA